MFMLCILVVLEYVYNKNEGICYRFDKVYGKGFRFYIIGVRELLKSFKFGNII